MSGDLHPTRTLGRVSIDVSERPELPESASGAAQPRPVPVDDQPRRSYRVRTYGCQMNVHDSERIAGLLEDAGYVRADGDGEDDADLVVFNTCAIRENADNKLYGNLSHLAPVKSRRPGMQIAVGGCLAQKDKDAVLDRAPWVDVVFGTHNIGSLPALLDRARHNAHAEVEILDSLEAFPSTLPAKRESAYSGWVSVSVGCNNTCTFCIVPSLRGKEVDRRPGDILAEVRALVDQGVAEITLLGQNVNAYGMSFADPELGRDRGAFAALLRACGDIDGLERVRFTSPHPAEFTDDVIEAMAQTPNVCPQLHMPLQSGSDRVLRAMRRSYRRRRFLGILDKVRAAMPDAAITTDIIVGFPGETEEDFAETLDVVAQARFASAFTFQYSPRPGTPAATMLDQVPPDVVADRYQRLIALQEDICLAENRAQVGREAELLVVADDGRKSARTHRMTGRARDGRLVHFAPGESASAIRPGDVVTTIVTGAAPHHLIADGAIAGHRRTRAGDAYEQSRTPTTAPVGVGLGMPSIGPSAPPASDGGCGSGGCNTMTSDATTPDTTSGASTVPAPTPTPTAAATPTDGTRR
ncbi:tRNA (N6-isopentenyl adenosine(37)-C2)-methylthiotransferase MiaB [Gordonia sinesedis]